MILSILSFVIVSSALALQVFLYARMKKEYNKRDSEEKFYVHNDVIVDKIEMREDGLLLIDGKPLFCEHRESFCGNRCPEFGVGITDNRAGRFFVCGFIKNAYFVKKRCSDCAFFYVDPINEPKEGGRRYGVMRCRRGAEIIPSPCSWFNRKQREDVNA